MNTQVSATDFLNEADLVCDEISPLLDVIAATGENRARHISVVMIAMLSSITPPNAKLQWRMCSTGCAPNSTEGKRTMTTATSVASNLYIEKQLSARQVKSLDMLPKETRKQIKRDAKQIALKDVFGEGHSTDRRRPDRTGCRFGRQHDPAAYRRLREKPDRQQDRTGTGYEDHLKRMRQQLAACDARRAAMRTADDDED